MLNRIIQCCLVSGHILPNLIPLLDTKNRPSKIWFFETEDVAHNGKKLEKICKSLGVAVERYMVDPFDIQDIYSKFSLFLERFSGQRAELNVTGGTKIMALGAYEACRGIFDSIFYIDTQNDRRVEISPRQQVSPLADVLTVRNCLQAYGYSLHSTDQASVPKEFRQATSLLARRAGEFQKPLRTLNYYASRAASQQTLCADMQPDVLRWKSFLELLQILKGAGILDWDAQGRLLFAGEDERFFANGGWLEQYVWSVVVRLRHDKVVTDLGANLEVVSENKVKNEIDVAFTARNRLFLIECKTRNFHNPDYAQEAIYKLQSLRQNLSGIYGKAVLISFSNLPFHERQRCIDNGIELVQGQNLENIVGFLKKCIDEA